MLGAQVTRRKGAKVTAHRRRKWISSRSPGRAFSGLHIHIQGAADAAFRLYGGSLLKRPKSNQNALPLLGPYAALRVPSFQHRSSG